MGFNAVGALKIEFCVRKYLFFVLYIKQKPFIFLTY